MSGKEGLQAAADHSCGAALRQGYVGQDKRATFLLSKVRGGKGSRGFNHLRMLIWLVRSLPTLSGTGIFSLMTEPWNLQ